MDGNKTSIRRTRKPPIATIAAAVLVVVNAIIALPARGQQELVAEEGWSPLLTTSPKTSAEATTESLNATSPLFTALAEAPPSVEEALRTRGTVTFRKTPISEVVFLLSDLWHINIVAGETVSGDVSGSFHDAPLSEVLAAVLTSSGYSYRKTGSSLVILSADQIGIDDPSFVSETVPLPPSLREDTSTLEAASLLLSERGQLKRIGTDLILVIDKPDRIERVRSLFQSLSPAVRPIPWTTEEMVADPPATLSAIPAIDTAAGISYFSLQFTEASELAVPIQQALGATVNVAIYAEENRLMVRGTPSELQIAAEMIEQLDRPRAQVRITAMIYDVDLKALERLGVNWARDLRTFDAEGGGDAAQIVSELFKFSSDLTGTGATSVGIRTLRSNLEAGVFLEAIDQTSEAKLLADPSITVGDRREASIRIVTRIPIIGANPIEGSNAVFTQVEFEEAGVILTVKPRISRDGTIELMVQPEYSAVTGEANNAPIIDSRTASTTVRVADGHMFVLGGLRQKTIREVQSGIPYLRDIKYLGKLFRSHNSEVRESELIVFLKPEIVTPYFIGDPRQQQAACVSQSQLDAIPYASVCPQTPCCEDLYCPNHHPRPRINHGSAELQMIGGEGLYTDNFEFESDFYYPLATPSEAIH